MRKAASASRNERSQASSSSPGETKRSPSRTRRSRVEERLANQAIALDLEVKPFLELGNLDFSDEHDNRTVSSYDQVCAMMEELEWRRSKAGIVVLVAPISGEICQGHGQACYVGNLKDRCPALKSTRRLIIVGRFMSEDDLGEVFAHELGHHAGRRLSPDSAEYGHEEYDKGNYMNYGRNRDHYRNELLDRMCGISFPFLRLTARAVTSCSNARPDLEPMVRRSRRTSSGECRGRTRTPHAPQGHTWF